MGEVAPKDMEWRDIESAPRDGTVFLAHNHDGEVYPAKYINDRLAFRMNGRYEPKRFEHVYVEGEKLLREDEEFAKANEEWQNRWVYWTRLYEIAPTHFMPLPPPPKGDQS